MLFQDIFTSNVEQGEENNRTLFIGTVGSLSFLLLSFNINNMSCMKVSLISPFCPVFHLNGFFKINLSLCIHDRKAVKNI